MAIVKVHNITDRENTPGHATALLIGGQKVRPGKFALVDEAALNRLHRRMVGTKIWIGELPERFLQPRPAPVVVQDSALTLAQVREYLQQFNREQLLEMAKQAYPVIDLREGAPKEAIIFRMSRALFHKERELDPETFFWLGRWTRTAGGFIPQE